MKRTRKRGALGDVAAVIAAAPTKAAAARQLGVNESTIHRWIAAGHADQPRVYQERIKAQANPDGWVAAYRDARDLDATQAELLGIAEQALIIAKDPEVPLMTRLTAMARFQSLVKQLASVEAAPQAQPVKPEPVRRDSGDPRALLVAVK